MSFPISPANNQTALVNGVSYVYNQTKGAWLRLKSTTQANLVSNTVTVLNSILFSDGTSQTTAATGIDSYARTTANSAVTSAQAAFDSANVIVGVNTTQNTNITAVNTYAASAYGAANTNSTNITVMQGVNTTQNTSITSADTKAQAAFDKANSGIKTTTSATKPTSNNAGDLWYSTSDDTLYQYTYDGTSNTWVDISGPILRTSNIVVQYTITANVS